MTFLSPIFLWFVPLALIPILIHLLAKQRSKLLEFPSLIFLKLLEQDALRKFNIKQLILLIIRTLIILLIILSFARPHLNVERSWNLSTHAVDLLVVAIDNTASNHANITTQSDTWFEQMVTAMESHGIKVYFCALNDLILHEDFLEIVPGYSDITPDDIESKLGEQIDLDQFRSKTIIWVGDGQDIVSKLSPLNNWDKYLLKYHALRDFGLLSVKLPPRTLRQGDSYTLGLNVGILGEDPAVSLELNINDRRVNQSIVTEENSYIELSTRVEEPGFQEGHVEIENDENNFNNHQYFVLKAGGSIPVQILRSPRTPDYWRIIASAINNGNLNLDIQLLSYAGLEDLNLSQGGTVIVDDASQIADYTWNRLKTFASLGGQVLLFGNGGERMNQLLHFSSPPRVESSQFPYGLVYTESARKGLSANALEKVISENRLKVYKRLNIASEELDDTWIRYSDNQPFLGATGIQGGRIVWFNTQFDVEANNLPLLGVFPTLIFQLCQYQHEQTALDPFNAIIGDTLHFLPTVQSNGSTLFSIQRPDGTVDFQAPDSNYVIHYTRTDLPGIYRFMQGRQIMNAVAVNISTHESKAYFENDGINESDISQIQNGASLIEEIVKTKRGVPLWPIFLLMIFGLMILETYLARIKSTWRQND
ncbi:MAG: BatA domain-containing protein [Candidatus Marinimicrobia bacterium]|nr:BatA domain-containing protein [Candidatus Neomarinimicrobiota bacterium]